MKIVDLAIVIPTLNEQYFIGKLLDSISRQSISPKEIVVIDAKSEDKTLAEIKKRQKVLPQLQFFQIPKFTVARQRNVGAQKTSASHILFLDADMELKKEDDLKKYFDEVLKRKPDVATARNLPNFKHWKNTVYFKAEDLVFKFSKYLWPVITARNLYVKRQVFNKIGGFDEEVSVGEDQELVHRIIKKRGKLIFLKNVKLYTSTRRLDKEGRRRYALKMILFGLDILLHGHKKSKVNYQFGKFTKVN